MTSTEKQSNDPVFAKDYVAHQPNQYSVTRAVAPSGEVYYLLSFIDAMLEPVIVGDRHNARERRQIRTSIQISKAFFGDILKSMEELETAAATAAALRADTVAAGQASSPVESHGPSVL